MIFQYHLADGLFLILINRLTEDSKPLFIFGESLLQPCRDIPDILLSHLLLIREDSRLHLFRRHDLFDLLKHLLGDRTAHVLVFRFTALCHDLIDKGNDCLVDLVRFIDRGEHGFFRNLIGAGLDHDHLLRRGCNGQPHIALVPLLLTGIDDQFPIRHADLRHRAGTRKRNIGDTGRDGCPQHRHQLRTTRGIHGHHHIV